MKNTHKFYFLSLLLINASLVSACPESLTEDMPYGEAKLKVFFWHIYDARLYSQQTPFDYQNTGNYCLELTYGRMFSKQALVDETIRQWQQMGVEYSPSWQEYIENIFPDVEKRDVISLHVDKQFGSHFYHNNQLIASIPEKRFTTAFAGIWLSAATSRPEMRGQLLHKENNNTEHRL